MYSTAAKPPSENLVKIVVLILVGFSGTQWFHEFPGTFLEPVLFAPLEGFKTCLGNKKESEL